MIITKTNIKKLYIIKPHKFSDSRGKFVRFYCKKEFKIKNIKFNNVQTNISYNKLIHTLRGFHMQKKPYEEDKIISCINGKIYCIVLDLRNKSETFKKWISFRLSDINNHSLIVPKGCATAWLTLEDNTIVSYLMSEYYKPTYSKYIHYNDPQFNFKWPCKPRVISYKDENIPILNFKFK